LTVHYAVILSTVFPLERVLMVLCRQGECTAVIDGKWLGRFVAVQKFVHGLVLCCFNLSTSSDKMQNCQTWTGKIKLAF